MGLQNQVTGTTDAEKQYTLGSQTNVDINGYTMVYEVKNVLNNYVSNNIYRYRLFEDESVNAFHLFSYHSLLFGRPVILHANTSYLSYYNGTELGHYISLYAVDSYGQAYLADCNWNDAYYGYHIVSETEARNSIDNRYLIYYEFYDYSTY